MSGIDALDKVVSGDSRYEETGITRLHYGYAWRKTLPDSGTESARCSSCGTLDIVIF